MRALVALAVACSAPAKPVIENTAAPVSPPPEVMRDLATRGLPAISADGTRIVVAVHEPDGDRAMPNLALMIKADDDFQLERHVVLGRVEADQFLDDADGKNPALDARVARANEWLRERHAALRLAPMTVLEVEASPAGGVRTRARRGALAVTWADNRLRITDAAMSLVDIQTPSSWLPEPDLGSRPCVYRAYLGGAAVDRAKKVALVTISNAVDGPLCSTPPDQHRVVTWR